MAWMIWRPLIVANHALHVRHSIFKTLATSPVSLGGLGREQPWRRTNIRTLPRFKNMTEQYDKAIDTLNNELQTNFALLEKVRFQRQQQAQERFERTLFHVEQAGMSLDDLDKLGVIHVSGTKGKGSTCAFCESILRQRGLTTGLYTSPHLLSVTERIRLNGEPIDKTLFAHYFWEVYDKIVSPNPPEERPGYFKFLTVLAYYIFWKEKVNVAIMEVGIGGRYDCTNVVRQPVICGITTLDIDHVHVLGSTIEEIAWHKAGIMKPGVPTIIDGYQTEGALKVLEDEAGKVGCAIKKIPALNEYDWEPFPPQALGRFGEVYHRNASVALQLARYYYNHFTQQNEFMINSQSLTTATPFKLDIKEALGLRLCKWPGRAQVITKPFKEREKGLGFFIDGAHTKLSMESCVTWFQSVSNTSKHTTEDLTERKPFRALIFNLTKDDREAKPLLQMLSKCDFDLTVFTPNVVKSRKTFDNINNTMDPANELNKCQTRVQLWSQVSDTKSVSVRSVNDAIDEVINTATLRDDVGQVQVLVTGSLHLLGNVLQVIDPNTTFKADLTEERKVSESYSKMM